jgi:hypothetical protein
MYKKVSAKLIMILATAAILTVPSSVLQVSYAQTDQDMQTVLAVHNRERDAVSIPPLVWSDELAAEAKTWAEHLATTGQFFHETAIFPAKGENIAGFFPSKGIDAPGEGVSGWADEKEDWNGAPVTDQNLYPIGHYVQMVSPASKAVGCGTASGNILPYSILVCRYDRSLFPQEPYIPLFMSQPAG